MVLGLTLSFTLPGEKGLVHAYHMNRELNQMRTENAQLKQNNYQLAQQAYLLRENMAYVEHVIIKEMNLVRPGDIVVVFKDKKTI